MFTHSTKALDEASTGGSGSASDTTVEQLQRQAQEYKNKYEELQGKISKGELVNPTTFVDEKVKAGELYPKDRFAGLQTKFNETQSALTELQSKSMEWQTNLSKLEETVKVKETKEEETALLVETLQRGKTRAQLIFSEFPELAPFEAEGLLPEAEEDKLKEVFGNFSAKLVSVKKNAASEFGKGGTGPTPPKKEESKIESAQAHLRLANEALAKSEFDTYNKEYDLYLAALQKQSV